MHMHIGVNTSEGVIQKTFGTFLVMWKLAYIKSTD